jgi:tyrosinase
MGTIINRPAVPHPIRIRRNLVGMAATDPVVVFYQRAIRRMKTLPLNDPLSWRYQAARHDYPRGTTVEERSRGQGDPFASSSDVLPSTSEQDTFWRQCQHASWFFLPWHRMYLHFFEKIVLSNVIALGGPTDWALPYWNYSTSDEARRLPAPFRNELLADGSRNDLFIKERHSDANAGGNAFASSAATDIAAAMGETEFAPAVTSDPVTGFGGPRILNHSGGRRPKGQLERVPHDAMHGAVGSPNRAAGQPERFPNGRFFGFMTSFTGAPLDPIFWVHHCNIDRLWTAWIRQGGGRANPTEPTWLTTPFAFHDATRTRVDMTSSQVVNTRAEPLAYVYDDEPV